MTAQEEVLYGTTRARFSSSKIANVARNLSTRLCSTEKKDEDLVAEMIKQLTTLDQESEEERAALREDLSAATSLLAQKDRLLQVETAKYEALSKRKLDETRRINDLEALVKSQERSLGANKIEIEALKAELEPLREALTARENAHKSQSSLVAELERANADLNRKYKLLHQRLDDEIQKLVAVKYDKAELARENETYKRTISHLMSQMEDATTGSAAVINELTHKVINANQDLQKLRAQVKNEAEQAPAKGRQQKDAVRGSDSENRSPNHMKKAPRKKTGAVKHPRKKKAAGNRIFRHEAVVPAGEVVTPVPIKSVTVNLANALAENVQLKQEVEKLNTEIASNAHVRNLQGQLDETKRKLTSQEASSKDLQRQLNKVMAEYRAVAVAHEYANAEVSKLRQEIRAPVKQPLGILSGVEHFLRHRRNHPYHAHADLSY